MNRLKSMLKVDFRRMLTSKLFYIMVAIALVIPVLVLVMGTAFGDAEKVDPMTGEITIVETEPITNAWEVVESAGGEGSGGMDMMSMCNINLLYFAVMIFVALFISDDFKSGYSKNLFTVRTKKTDYVISKTVVGFVGGAAMILAYLLGTLLGGAIAGLSFETDMTGVVMCILAKIFLMLVFVGIAIFASVCGKQKTWVCILGSCMAGMLLFSMISALTPLDSTVVNVLLCLIGGGLFALGVGAGSGTVLNRTSLV